MMPASLPSPHLVIILVALLLLLLLALLCCRGPDGLDAVGSCKGARASAVSSTHTHRPAALVATCTGSLISSGYASMCLHQALMYALRQACIAQMYALLASISLHAA
jgi:hypothetical protein